MDDFIVRDGLWDAETTIAKVYHKRHTVIFPERDEPTTVTFCNNCGCPFTFNSNPPTCSNCKEEQ